MAQTFPRSSQLSLTGRQEYDSNNLHRLPLTSVDCYFLYYFVSQASARIGSLWQKKTQQVHWTLPITHRKSTLYNSKIIAAIVSVRHLGFIGIQVDQVHRTFLGRQWLHGLVAYHNLQSFPSPSWRGCHMLHDTPCRRRLKYMLQWLEEGLWSRSCWSGAFSGEL